ncbi:MAG: helix-turn-helix domain-containing protein [Variovorax sp.]|nr:helix-turn-helix domain-containing protein [Variovorax sp.]
MAGLYGVLAGVLKSLADQLTTLPPASCGAVSEAVLTLLRSALTNGASGDFVRQQLTDVMKERLKQLILRHLGNPDLNLDMLASELRCSKRYLHRVFEGEECSIERYIWNARLERCHAALRASAGCGANVSSIAFEWGFSSSAHFSRLFRGRFGVSPSEVQKQAGMARPC